MTIFDLERIRLWQPFTVSKNLPRLLIIGYGNPGRQDDGLGVRFAERIETWAAAAGLHHITCRTDIQLNVEHALALKECDVVLFADAASESATPPFRLRRLTPAATTAFSTHALNPETVLAWAAELYDARPEARLLTIRGHSWGLIAALSPPAAASLEAAIAHMQPLLQSPHAAFAPSGTSAPAG